MALSIEDVAKKIGVEEQCLEMYGNYKAKISLGILDDVINRKSGKYIVTTVITPTLWGEGKTTTTIGLSQAFWKLGNTSIATLRQSSLGPLMGRKGHGIGGGLSRVIPEGDIALHLTGDTHAICVAHNLIASAIDNHLFYGNKLGINVDRIFWTRTIDLNDRGLRDRGFILAGASELMSIVSLAKDYLQMKRMVAGVIFAEDVHQRPLTVENLKCTGAVCSLIKDTLKPTLVQSTSGTPIIIHTSPFANISHGNCSVISDIIATKLCEYTITESGFGADLGFEKFVDIKCRSSGLKPDCAVLICTVRALKVLSGKYKMKAIRKVVQCDTQAVIDGCQNLAHMVKIIKTVGVPVVVALNRFDNDFDEEINTVMEFVKNLGVVSCEVIEPYQKGAEGMLKLAEAVKIACQLPSNFQFLYNLHDPVLQKIKSVAKICYNAKDILLEGDVRQKIEKFLAWGYQNLPVCIAKTHLSVSHDPNIKGVPEDYTFPINDIKLSAGAGYIYPIAGSINLMPGLPRKPNLENLDIDEKGNILGLS